ncbi:MAG TPA: ASCH domain-containing protein [Tepidisphaeraceae bacterium]
MREWQLKTLSLWQPWAQLIAVGAKRIETRGWSTKVRGPIAIHAAAKRDRYTELTRVESPFGEALQTGGWDRAHALPRGCVIATCVLDDCLSIAGGSMWQNGNRLPLPDMPERAFGNYTPGRFALVMKDVRVLAKPLPWKGGQKWFNVDDAAIDACGFVETGVALV